MLGETLTTTTATSAAAAIAEQSRTTRMVDERDPLPAYLIEGRTSSWACALSDLPAPAH